MRKTLSILCIAVAAGGAIAGCGSSSSSNNATTASGVVLAPSGGATSAAATPATSATTPATSATTSSSTSSSNVKLPTAFNTEPTIKTPGGTPPKKLVVKNLIIGTGPKLTSPSSTITIAYVGALYSNGKVFDSSWKDDPSTHTISQAASGFVPGFEQGLLGMRVGGRRELIIPPSLAYGSKANGAIPANSTLIFIVDLHSIS
jgi:FKBP-type peptidyl-prolyl cis-trans isomerase